MKKSGFSHVIVAGGTPASAVSHSDHRGHIGEHNSVHAGNIARDGGKPKGDTVEIHGGMHRVTNGRVVIGGGHAASVLDSLSGQTVVPGQVKTAPGWGNGDVRSGHPLAKPAASKNLKLAPVAFGMLGGKLPKELHGPFGQVLDDLGEACLKSAFKVADGPTRRAHGRNKDGSRCK